MVVGSLGKGQLDVASSIVISPDQSLNALNATSSAASPALLSCAICKQGAIGVDPNSPAAAVTGAPLEFNPCECALPICRGCYEYIRLHEGNRCPQCHSPYKRLPGSPPVPSDPPQEVLLHLEEQLTAGNSSAAQNSTAGYSPDSNPTGQPYVDTPGHPVAHQGYTDNQVSGGQPQLHKGGGGGSHNPNPSSSPFPSTSPVSMPSPPSTLSSGSASSGTPPASQGQEQGQSAERHGSRNGSGVPNGEGEGGGGPWGGYGSIAWRRGKGKGDEGGDEEFSGAGAGGGPIDGKSGAEGTAEGVVRAGGGGGGGGDGEGRDLADLENDVRRPLSRTVPVPARLLNPYR